MDCKNAPAQTPGSNVPLDTNAEPAGATTPQPMAEALGWTQPRSATDRAPAEATSGPAPTPARPVADSIGPVVPTNSATQWKPCATTAGSASPAASPAGLAAPTTFALASARSATPQATASCVVPAAMSVVLSAPVWAATSSAPLAIAFPAERRTSSAAPTTYATPPWCVPVEPAGSRASMAEARRPR
jgi:hypothetical protein